MNLGNTGTKSWAGNKVALIASITFLAGILALIFFS